MKESVFMVAVRLVLAAHRVIGAKLAHFKCTANVVVDSATDFDEEAGLGRGERTRAAGLRGWVTMVPRARHLTPLFFLEGGLS